MNLFIFLNETWLTESIANFRYGTQQLNISMLIEIINWLIKIYKKAIQ